jgi:hypothetical protein
MNQAQESNNIVSNKHTLGVWIASAWLSFFLVFFITWSWLPDDMTLAIHSLSARFLFTLAHVFCASLLLFLGFLAVGATRWQLETADTSANPAISGDRASTISADNRVHTQFLSNTTEQFVMFSAALLAATPFLTQPYLRVITLMTILWVFARLFFWGGYWYTVTHNLPTYPRAIGLGMGLLCTLCMASIAAIGICLHFPSFSAMIDMTALSNASSGNILIQPAIAAQGSNLIPIVFFSFITFMIAALAILPKIAPPVIPMAVISMLGWIWLLVSGTIPIR